MINLKDFHRDESDHLYIKGIDVGYKVIKLFGNPVVMQYTGFQATVFDSSKDLRKRYLLKSTLDRLRFEDLMTFEELE